MAKLAVNIALIHDESMYSKVLDLNKKLVTQGSDLVLGASSIPHITLTQGVIEEHDIQEVNSALGRIASETKPLSLIVDELFNGPMSKSIWLKIKRNDSIDAIHKRVWSELEPYLTFYADKNMFVKPDEIHEEISWIKNFPLKSIWDQYKPHITLGFGQIEVNLPIQFKADKLTIYQMGKYCGCSREIQTYKLQ